MKTKTWILLLAVLLLLSAGASVLLLMPGKEVGGVEVWSEGKHLYTLSLKEPQQLTVQTASGANTITIRDGKVAVTEADCPDGYCMDRGYCSDGAQIVCLPNRLVLKFVGEQTVDGIAG